MNEMPQQKSSPRVAQNCSMGQKKLKNTV